MAFLIALISIYCVYFTVNDSEAKLDPVQNAAIRIATGAFMTSPIISLQSEAGIKSIEAHREIKIMNCISRTLATPIHLMYEQLAGNLAEAE